MYNVQPSSIYIFKRRPPRADPPNGGGEKCSNATTNSSRFWQSCLCRCSVAQASEMFRPPGPEVWMTFGVLYKLYSMFNMMDDGLLLNVFDVWCVAMLLASTMIISVL